jgi:tetratricopeptide (TPR) repeat protein
MYKNKIGTLLLIVAVAPLGSCGGSRDAAVVSRYQRQPIHEVTEAQLKSDSRLIDALSLQATGHEGEALAAYAALTHDDPSCAAAWYEMGRMLLMRGWTDSAETCARRAVDLQPSNTWYLLALTQVQSRRGDSRGLTQTWERLVKLNPTVLDYYYELSNAYLETQELPKAVEVLNRVERMIGVTEPISLQKQKIWNAAGKPDKALREVEALADALPHEKRYQAILAENHMQQRHYSKAKQYYDRILATDPDDPYIHIQLAEYYKALGRTAEADSEMVTAFRNPALDGKSKLQILGSFYSEEEFYNTRSAVTFRLMDLAMAGCKDSTEFALFYGDVLMRQGKYDEAARQFDLSLRSDSSRYEVWEALLICLTEVPSQKALLADRAQRAARLFPMHTLPHYLLAMNDYEEKDYDGALTHLADAMKWGFTKGYLEAECYGLEAECHYRAGHYDKAWKAFDRYLTLHPDDMPTLNNYAYYLAEQHLRLDDAERMSRRTIDAEPDNANSLDTYAWILHLLGRDREALPYIEKAVRLNGASDTLLSHLRTIQNSLQ